MGEVSFDIVGVDKASDAFQKVGRSVDDTGDKLDKLSKIKEPPAPVNLTKGLKDALAASDRLSKARRFEADQLGKVRVAEAKLGELREFLAPGDSQLVAAEERLAAAHRGVAEAQRDAARAASALNDARANAVPKQKVDLSKGLLDIKSGLVSEFKSAGLIAGASLGGGIAAGLSTVGAAGLFIGIAAAAQSSNAQVAAAYTSLWAQVKQGAQETSRDLAGNFIQGAEKLGATFNALKPQLSEGFQAAKPAINDMFDGISRGVQTAMPGLVTGAKAASLATNGLADMMDSAGRGVSAFFTESSKGAAAGGEAFRSLGVIIERMGGFAGRMFAELANNSGNVFPALEGAVDSAAGAVENLAHTALPSLASGASFALSGLGLLLNLASTLIGALGPLIPVVTSLATGLKLVDMVSFGQVGKSWATFKQSIGDADGPLGKVKAGFGGLLTTLGPVGLAAGLVTVGLGYLSAEQQEAADAARRHADRVDMLSDALRKSKGVIDDGVRASAADALQKMKINVMNKDMLTGARELNISQSRLTDAYLGNSNALAAVNHELDTVMSPYKDYNDMVKRATPEEQKRWMLAELIKDTLNKQGGEFQQAAQKQRDYAAATGMVATNTGLLADEFGTLGNATATAEQKIQALMRVMDKMAGRNTDVEGMAKAWEEFLDTFNAKDAGFESKAAGTKKWAAALVDARGEINLTTADGRKLFDLVRTAEQDFASTAQAMRDTGASSEEIRGRLQGMRDDFIGLAQRIGFTKDQAVAMADKFGLVPGNVSVLVSTNLAPEIQKALELGGQIKGLPDGDFIVTANTGPAQGMITQLIQNNQGRVITLHVNTVSGATLTNSQGTFSRYKAKGGWISGPGTTTSDSVPTMLSNREFVVRADAARKHAALLEQINSGGGPGLSAAGVSLTPAGGGTTRIEVVLMPGAGFDQALGRAVVGNLRAQVQGNGGNVDRLLGGNRK